MASAAAPAKRLRYRIDDEPVASAAHLDLSNARDRMEESSLSWQREQVLTRPE